MADVEASSYFRADLVCRAAVTVAVPSLTVGLEHVALPGVDVNALAVLDLVGLSRPFANLSVGALGLAPFVSAYILVEIAAVAVPRWRAVRTGGPSGRARLTRAAFGVAALLSLVQGFGVTMWLESMWGTGLLAIEPGWGFRAVTTLTLAAGSFAMVAAAIAIERYGFGNGFSVLIAWGLASRGSGELLRLDAVEDGRSAGLKLVALAGVIAFITMLLLSRRDHDSQTLRTPSCGLVPLVWTASLFALPITVADLGIAPVELPVTTPGTFGHDVARVALVAVFAVLLTKLFNAPSRVARARRALSTGGQAVSVDGRRDASIAVRTSLVISVAAVVALAVATSVAYASDPRLWIDAVSVAIVAAVILDVASEWKVRVAIPDAVPVWPVHRTYVLDPAIALLRSEGIPAFVRGARHRVLLQFFGPHVPMEICVAAEHAERARRVLGPRFAELVDGRDD